MELKKEPHYNEASAEQIFYTASEEKLRDDFAGRAMAQMCAGDGATMVANRDGRYLHGEMTFAEVVADNAYNFADAMILRRRQ